VALPRLLVAWLALTVWFLLWQEGRRRLGDSGGNPPLGGLRVSVLPASSEALLLTLFAALWFASLGHGGWLLLFCLVAALVEVPVRIRPIPASSFPWRVVILGMMRILGAGALLTWRLG